MILSRRHLISGAAAFALWPRRLLAAEADRTEAMLKLLTDRRAAAKLGAHWVEDSRREPNTVLESLQQRLRWSPQTSGSTLRHNLANAVADDFRAGEVMKVEGWQMARTQIELCALAFFAATKRF